MRTGPDAVEGMQQQPGSDGAERQEDGREKPTAERKKEEQPRLRTVSEYYKEKFDAEFLKIIVSGMQERTSNSIADGTREFKKMVFQKSRAIENYMDTKLGRNPPMARRREPTKLPPLASTSFTGTSQHPFDSQQPSIITSAGLDRTASSGAPAVGSSRMRGDLQEDSILSARAGDVSAP